MTDIRKGTCPVCNHDEIVCAEAIEFGARNTTGSMAVAYDGKDGVYGFKHELDQARGTLRTYTCRSCGYTQWYADAPDSIPIDRNLRTRLIRAE